MKHILTLAALVFSTSCFGQEACPELWTACGEGTIWDEASQTCIVANVSDTDFDGCVGINDFLIHLSNFGSGCGPELPWSCGDQLEYQGYYYETVQIGEQCWFAENLRAENYRSGLAIPSGLNDLEWSQADEGAYSVCDDSYGLLYNAFVMNEDSGICPEGWSPPNNGDWQELMVEIDSDALWGPSSSGFSGLAGGYRIVVGYCSDVGVIGNWWGSYGGDYSGHFILGQGFSHFQASASQETDSRNGYSIRCIQDPE